MKEHIVTFVVSRFLDRPIIASHSAKKSLISQTIYSRERNDLYECTICVSLKSADVNSFLLHH